MSCCVMRRCSRICHAEYGSFGGFFPLSSTGMPRMALSKPTWASSHASRRARCSRTAVSSLIRDNIREMSLAFSNTVVGITGAAGGIGRELCRYFAGEGAAIAAFDKSDAVYGFAAELRSAGARVESVVVNIVDTAAVAEAFQRTASGLGPVDVLINNAGITTHPTIEGTPPDGFVEELYVNLIGAYACTYAVIPSMKARRRGSIVNIGSVNGLMAL